MISVEDALGKIREQATDFGHEVVPLLMANGRLLAQDIKADRDFPPFDRVTMDGIAIDSRFFTAGHRTYQIEKIQPAGIPQQILDDPQKCIEVMTGAVLPLGCDAVVPYEDCAISEGFATVQITTIRPKQNIHFKGSDERSGQVIVAAGTTLTPAMIGIAATVGLEEILVKRLPRVAVCSTGNELVTIDQVPADHQIRRSNNYMLAAALQDAQIRATMHHLPDEPAEMREILQGLLGQYDVLLFSGAVSKGKYDHLPEVLSALGMQTIFHRVAQKPGKPLLFGRFGQGAVVFGFPGNPVSTMVCFRVFFSAWLAYSLGTELALNTAHLGIDFTFKPALSYHLPVTVTTRDGQLWAMPSAGSNSGDMVGLAQANATLLLPAARHDFKKGEVFPLTWLQQPH